MEGNLHMWIVVALQVLVRQVGLTVLLALCQCHVQWLPGHDAVVHVRHSLRRLIRAAEADKAEPLRPAILHHHLQSVAT